MNPSKISFFSIITFMVLFALLHILEPEIEPTWRFISDYSLGKYGWLMNITFFAWASAYLFLFFALRKQVTNIWGKIGLVCLIISAIGCIIAGIFNTDPITTEIPTQSGSLHSLGGTLCMAMPISALFIGISLYKNPNWVGAKKTILLVTIFALIGFMVSAGTLGYLFSQPNAKPSPDLWIGIPTRFEIATYCAWLITVSKNALKITDRE